jgi:hypothetical protein
MKAADHKDATSDRDSFARSRWLWFFVIACAFVILVGLLRGPRQDEPVAAVAPSNETGEGGAADSPTVERTQSFPRRLHSAQAPEPTAAEIVAVKLSRFAQSRRGLAHALGKRHKVEVPVMWNVFRR